MNTIQLSWFSWSSANWDPLVRIDRTVIHSRLPDSTGLCVSLRGLHRIMDFMTESVCDKQTNSTLGNACFSGEWFRISLLLRLHTVFRYHGTSWNLPRELTFPLMSSVSRNKARIRYFHLPLSLNTFTYADYHTGLRETPAVTATRDLIK